MTDRRSPAPKHDLGSSPAAEEWSRAGIPARVEELAPLRRQVQAWANSTHLSTAQVGALILATYEAMANVVAHAYAHGAGVFDVRAAATQDQRTVTVTVTDAGRWKTPSAQGIAGGRGLPLMRGLADYQEVHSTADGTRVTLRWNCA